MMVSCFPCVACVLFVVCGFVVYVMVLLSRICVVMIASGPAYFELHVCSCMLFVVIYVCVGCLCYLLFIAFFCIVLCSCWFMFVAWVFLGC